MTTRSYKPVKWFLIFVNWNAKKIEAVVSKTKEPLQQHVAKLANPMDEFDERPVKISDVRTMDAGEVKGPTKKNIMDSFPDLFPWRLKEKNKVIILDSE